MTLSVLHLRWNDLDPEQYDLLRNALPEDGGRPPGCLSRRHVRQTRAVMVYEVWDDERAAEVELARVRALLDAGPTEPQRIVMELPDVFAAGFGRTPAGPRPAAAAPAAAPIPAPRSPVEAPVSATPVG